MSRFCNERLQSLNAYVPGEQPKQLPLLKLNTNESPYPPSEKVNHAIACARSLQLYSDIDCQRLRRKMAQLYGIGEQNLYFANGSDDILNFAFAAFARGEVAFPEISYGFYPVFADLYALTAHKVPLCEDFSVDAAHYEGLNCFIVLANPNAPTGMLLPVSDIERIVISNPDHVVLIDEAYIDFGGESCYPLTEKYPNLLVVGTFSKSRSMAGARLGFAIGNELLIADLEKLKFSTNPYNVNSLTQAAAEAVIDDNAYSMDNCRKIIHTRTALVSALQALGFEVLPSKANFVFVRSTAISGSELYNRLKERGILIRHFDTEKLRDFNRITIGTPENMAFLIENIQKLLEEKANEKK